MSESPLSVLHVDTGREYRGGQRQVELLLRGLVQRGHRVGLAMPPDAPLAQRLAHQSSVQLHPIAFRGELSPGAAWSLRAALIAGGYRLLHVHTAHAITPAQLARIGCGVPLIAHRRVDFPLRRHRLARWKAQWPDAWIAVAEGVRVQLIRDGLPGRRIAVVESAIDPARLSASRGRDAVRQEFSIPPSARWLGSVGELAVHKGHASLIAALESFPNVHAWIVGDGAERAALQRQLRNVGADGRVCLLGFRDDVADLLSALDLFVFPSLSGEGSPAALKEAIALGVPVLASDIPAHRDLGLPAACLFNPGDPVALRACIEAILGDLDRARASARERRATIERFLPERLVSGTEAVYRAVLSKSSDLSRLSLESPAPER